MQIPHQDERSDAVTLSGSKDAVESARRELEERVRDFHDAQFTCNGCIR